MDQRRLKIDPLSKIISQSLDVSTESYNIILNSMVLY